MVNFSLHDEDNIRIPPETFLLVGLGNPGREYRETRHNIGFQVIDTLCKELDVHINRVQFKALVGQGGVAGQKIIVAKPQSYMNLSGKPVSALIRYYKIVHPNLLVIHDDMDLPLGTLRMRPGGGSAGQKGLISIIQELGTQNFPRLRMGIGRPPGQMDSADYVLQRFSKNEQDLLKVVLESAVQASLTFVQYGLDRAMNQFNGVVQGE